MRQRRAQDEAVLPIRVLIVDDSLRMRAVLRDLLEMDGRFRVAGEAGDGEQAIREAERTRPDVVVLDVEMPVLGGLEALPQIAARCPSTRVVVFSSHPPSELAGTAIAAGAAAYVEKGANVSDLLAAVAAERSRRYSVPAPSTGSA
jgi:DNA-binding NarL/FixJ family response regulator